MMKKNKKQPHLAQFEERRTGKKKNEQRYSPSWEAFVVVIFVVSSSKKD